MTPPDTTDGAPLDASPEITAMVERLTREAESIRAYMGRSVVADIYAEAAALLRRLGEREARMPDFAKLAAGLEDAEFWVRQVSEQPPSRVAPGIAKAAGHVAVDLKLTRAAFVEVGKETI